jgi:hypothetical protein
MLYKNVFRIYGKLACRLNPARRENARRRGMKVKDWEKPAIRKYANLRVLYCRVDCDYFVTGKSDIH